MKATGGRASDDADTGALRCCCGSLLARIVDSSVELKCRRCKRVVLLPLSPPGTGPPEAAPIR